LGKSLMPRLFAEWCSSTHNRWRACSSLRRYVATLLFLQDGDGTAVDRMGVNVCCHIE